MTTVERLLREVIETHGGLEKWRAVRLIEAQIHSGGLNKWKNTRAWIPPVYNATASPRDPQVVIHPFSGTGKKGVLRGRAVSVQREDGSIVAERAVPRPGGLRRLVSWDQLDALFFAAYAVWNYLCFPFLLLRPGVEGIEMEPWYEKGERWRRVLVTFPENTPTHSRQQIFYFDDQDWLRRFDYSVERFGSWVRGMHYWGEYRDFSGIQIATKRWATVRMGGPRAGIPLPAYWMRILDASILFD